VYLNQSVSGKAKHIDTLSKEFVTIINKHPVKVQAHLDEEVQQDLNVVFEKPSLLVACKLKHRFEIGPKLAWFECLTTNKSSEISYNKAISD